MVLAGTEDARTTADQTTLSQHDATEQRVIANVDSILDRCIAMT
jgi:hypothetical protein